MNWSQPFQATGGGFAIATQPSAGKPARHKGPRSPRTGRQALTFGIHSRPLDLARSWQRPSTWRRSGLSIRLQRVISSTVRWQPVQISCSSSAQIFTQGEGTGRSGGVIPGLPGDRGRNAAHCAHSARHWLGAASSAARSTHAPPGPATPSPANHREFPYPRRSANWRR